MVGRHRLPSADWPAAAAERRSTSSRHSGAEDVTEPGAASVAYHAAADCSGGSVDANQTVSKEKLLSEVRVCLSNSKLKRSTQINVKFRTR